MYLFILRITAMHRAQQTTHRRHGREALLAAGAKKMLEEEDTCAFNNMATVGVVSRCWEGQGGGSDSIALSICAVWVHFFEKSDPWYVDAPTVVPNVAVNCGKGYLMKGLINVHWPVNGLTGIF